MDTVTELVQLGLTEAETRCYQFLVSEGAGTAYEVAAKLNMFSNAVYRLMAGLVKKGFVVELETRPSVFQPIPPSVAIDAYAKLKIKQIEEQKFRVLERFSKPALSRTRIHVLTGRNAMFDAYIQLAKEATKEIFIISIGEEVGDEIKLVNRDAIERGVSIKLIAHRHDKSNEALLQNWVAMGVMVRHVPDQGFHLVVVDGEKSIFSVNNPTHTHERLSLFVNNQGLSAAFQTYFRSLWNKAKPV